MLHGIAIVERKPKLIPGYVGKPKGSKQILYKHGFIDENGLDVDGNPVNATRALEILATCEDFKNEKTKLEHIVEKLGNSVHLTPIFHPEISGRGIEFAWGYSKFRFRKDFNNGAPANLKKNMEMALSRNVLTTLQIKKYLRKSCYYKLAYLNLSKFYGVGKVPMEKIEKMTKSVKSHRSPLDLDYAFVTKS